MSTRRTVWALAFLLAITVPCGAQDDTAHAAREIRHPLDHVAASDCRFIRNGKSYDARAAREHIKQKYDYFRSRIRTAEDFIRWAASQSSMSGEPYRIRCGAETMRCADWLRAELERLRQTE